MAHGNYDGIEKERELDNIFGWDFNWYRTVGSDNGLRPKFECKVFEELPDGTQWIQNHVGLIEKMKPGINSIPSEDAYLLKDQEAFETLFRPKMLYLPERVDLEFYKHLTISRTFFLFCQVFFPFFCKKNRDFLGNLDLFLT